MRKKVLGVGIDDVSMTEAARVVEGWLNKSLVSRQSGQKLSRIIVTPGPEFLVTAKKDEDFKKILNAADLSLPDGFGLKLAGIKNRVPGTDFMLELCRLAKNRGWRVGLFGGEKGVAKVAGENLQKKFIGIKIEFAIDGEEADEILNRVEEFGRRDPSAIARDYVDLLFVALGHPKQEKFLWELKRMRHPWLNFKVGMGVGGAFDYISGKVARPSWALQGLGLEWLGRLLNQPNRIRRIVNAAIIFPLLLLRERLEVEV